MSDSNSTTEQKSIYTDNRAVLGQGSIQATGGSQVAVANYTLDQEAVNRSLETVDNTVSKALNLVGDNSQMAVSTVANFGGRVLDQVVGTEHLVADAYNDAKGQGALTQKILIAAVVGALFVALVAVQKHA